MNTADSDRAEPTPTGGVVARAGDALRLVVAGLLLVGGPGMGLGQEAPRLFFVSALGYLTGAVFLAVVPGRLRAFAPYRSVAVALLDAAAFLLFLATSGGFASGLPTLLFVLVFASALEAEPRLALFHAALAALVLLGENLWRFWRTTLAVDPFFVGAAGAGLFVAAWLAYHLGARLRRAERAQEAQQALIAWQRTVNDRIVQELADGVLWIDSDGVVRYASPRVVAWLGEDPSGQPLSAVIDEPIAPGEERWRRHGGVLWRLKGGMRDRDGVWLLFLTDFAAVQRTFRQEQLAALGLLVSGVAHEVRNPLAGVVQALDLLRDAVSEAERAELIAVALRNAARITHLIDDVLLFGRPHPPQPRAVALKGWLEAWAEELPLSERKRLAVVGSAAATAWVDPEHLRTVVENLVRNALAFASLAEGAVEVRVGEEGEQVTVEVADDGPGVAEGVVARLFEPFVSERPNGTGLGLYLVHELVRANGGEVHYRRSNRGGASFIVQLPAASAVAAS